MQIDIGAYIAELLYDHPTVNVPALGGFVTHYEPATVDQVGGKITPPSKSLKFNKNLVLDDGLLINYIEEKNGISYAEAQESLANYVETVVKALDRREIVVFTNVGRLYRDYENNLQFLPDKTNFNTDVYGLPDVEFTPLAHIGREPKAGAATPIAAKAAATPVSGRIYEWFRRNLAVISVLSILVVALGFYFLYFNKKTHGPVSEGEKTVPTARLNVKPAQPDEDSAEITDPGAISPTKPEATPDETTPEEESTETEAATLAPGQQYCVIRLGYFGDPDNVERLVEQIFQEGFEPYTEPSGKLTLVGVQFAYQNEADIERTLREVRNKFESKAKVIRK